MTKLRQWRIRRIMQTSIVEAETYLATAKDIMSAEEMESVVTVISTAPMSGDVIPGGRGLRKLRIPLQGRGKRGGGRVIYWYYNEGYPAVLLLAYAKSDKKDLSQSQLKSFVRTAEYLIEDFRSTT